MNFCVSSFSSSLELIKFQDLLRRVPPSEQSDYVIFYNGYNDVNGGYLFGGDNMQADLSFRLLLLIEKKYAELIRYCLFFSWSEKSILFRDYVAKWIGPGSRLIFLKTIPVRRI
jgi:hypothetical protein